MTHVPPFAPGCFGSALAFDGEHAVCRGCVFRAECQPLHEQNLAMLRARYGIVRSNKITPAKVTAEPVGETFTLPKKVQELVDKLDRANLRIAEKLKAGENPFASTMPYLQITCHLLLRLNKPITRQLLTAAFQSKLHWQAGTADAHARMAVQALVHVGAVTDTDGQIQLRRSE